MTLNKIICQLRISHYTYLLAVHHIIFYSAENQIQFLSAAVPGIVPFRKGSLVHGASEFLCCRMIWVPPPPFPIEMAPPSLFLSTLAPAPAPLYLSKTERNFIEKNHGCKRMFCKLSQF
jgi:hypothetical protein